MALACFVKACGVVFLGVGRSPEADRARESDWRMRGAMISLAVLCVAIGLAPILLGWAHVAIATAMSAGAWWLVRRSRRGLRYGVTWDCAYVAPAARMQYSAESFASIITGWFAFILRPEVHARPPVDILPASASQVSHTPETVLQYLVEPLSRRVMRVATAARALQHGGVQSYLLYLVIGIAGLGIVVTLGGGR